MIRSAHTDLDIVIPVHNQRAALEASVRMLHGHLSRGFPFSWQITIVDSASTDGTLRVARRLMYELPEVGAMHVRAKGRGLALRTAWIASGSDVVAYLDADLSTDLGALLPLVAPLLAGHSDLAIHYGFQAIRAGAAHELIPLVADDDWIFDTELLVLAQRRGLRIHKVPVDWVQNGESRVELVPTALADLRGVMRLLWDRPSGRGHRTLPSPRRPMLAP